MRVCELQSRLSWTIPWCSAMMVLCVFLWCTCGCKASPPLDAPVATDGECPPFGFTSFPYDATAKAIEHTYSIARQHGGIYVIHRDNGIPWYEALNELPYPVKVTEKWRAVVAHRPENTPVYLALAPLGEDRETPIRASEGSERPNIFAGCRLDDQEFIKAYTNYVLQAVATLNPDFLNLGIEAGELAFRAPAKWPQFETLFTQVRSVVKREHPTLSVGISFGLQSLMEPGMIERTAALVAESDFVGISFYPYMSAFHERFGTRALPPPPGAWREPLQFLASFVPKPVAICETGYSSADVYLSEHRLSLKGSPALQDQYLRELSQYARRDSYLFVVWFMPVDYEKLFETLPKGDGSYRLWQNIGFFDSNLSPKPAWETWKSIVAGSARAEQPATPEAGRKGCELTFAHDGDLFSPSPNDAVRIASMGDHGTQPVEFKSVMEWSYAYHTGQWQWIATNLETGTLSGLDTLRIDIRSDREGPILLQLEEVDGEAFYCTLSPSSEWQNLRHTFAGLSLSPDTRKDGTLNPDRVIKVMLADAGAVTEGATGERSVRIGRLEFR